MDACDFVGGVKVEENAGIAKLRSLKCVAKAFRAVEFCFVVFLLLWIFTRLPFAVRISGEYLRQLIGVVLSPVFIFILYNFIVLTLFMKSDRRSGDSSIFGNVAGAEVLYDSFLKSTEFSTDFSVGNSSLVPENEAQETVYEDKQTIFEEHTVPNQESSGSEEPETVMNKALMKPKVPRRTQSEKLDKEEEISVKLIRRSEMEKCRKVTNSGDTAHEVDELSNEEFQKAIENFIAKQTKFHQQEKLAIVLHSQA